MMLIFCQNKVLSKYQFKPAVHCFAFDNLSQELMTDFHEIFYEVRINITKLSTEPDFL